MEVLHIIAKQPKQQNTGDPMESVTMMHINQNTKMFWNK